MAADRRLGRLDDLPRARLAHLPTPLEEMPNLAARLGGGVRLTVKRDDCTGLAMGGNKIRQLEFYMGAAQTAAADTILITGAVQSNFVRAAAAAACKLGMDCHIQLEERVPRDDPLYHESGNVLLDKLLGATLHAYPKGEDEAGADARIAEIAAGLKAEGRRPYIIRLAPGHPPLGALGYVDAARELVAQMADGGPAPDEIVVASGSGHTHGGLLFGLRALGCAVPVTGICVRRAAGPQFERVASHCRQIAALLAIEPVVDDGDIHLVDEFLAPGYGQLNGPAMEAIALAARLEALILDPVYTGKTMAGLIQRARDGGAGRALLFIHSGGAPALFAYGNDLTDIRG